MSYPFGETVTRLRGVPAASPYSQDAVEFDFTSAAELDIDGVAVAPAGNLASSASASRNPVEEDRHPVQDGFVLYFADPVELVPVQDRIRVRGGSYRIVGRPEDWTSPLSGWSPGTVVNVRRVVG